MGNLFQKPPTAFILIVQPIEDVSSEKYLPLGSCDAIKCLIRKTEKKYKKLLKRRDDPLRELVLLENSLYLMEQRLDEQEDYELRQLLSSYDYITNAERIEVAKIKPCLKP